MNANLHITGFTVKDNDIDTVTYLRDTADGKGEVVTKSVGSGGGGGVKVQQNKDFEITSNGREEILPDVGFDAVAKMSVTTKVPVTLYVYGGSNIDLNPTDTVMFAEKITAPGTYIGLATYQAESQGETGLFTDQITFVVSQVNPYSGRLTFSEIWGNYSFNEVEFYTTVTL